MTISNKVIILLLVFITSSVLAKITKGPYLVKPTENSMTIMWESNIEEEAKIIYWKNEDNKLELHTKPFDHQKSLYLYRITIDELKANTKYFYTIEMSDDISIPVFFITAPPKDKSFRFIAMGDSRSGHDTFANVSKLVKNENPGLIISMGDLVLSGKEFSEWSPHFFTPAKSMLNSIPFVSTLGDHETRGNYNGYNFFYYFRNGKSTEKQWFSYDYGDVHFVSLDFRGEFNEEMIEWFKNNMANSDAKWKIVYLHRPTYNLGGHRANWGNPIWQKLYSDYKVDIVFAGHSHIYERFYPVISENSSTNWAVTYITTGGAGAGLYNVINNEFIAVAESVNHFIVVDVSKDTLKINTKSLNGETFDSFKIVKENGTQSKDYLELAQKSFPLDIYMAFAHNLELHIKTDLENKKYFTKKISFNLAGINVDVPFKIRLKSKSNKHYKMTPINGVLKKNSTFSSEITIYTKDKFVGYKKYFFKEPLFLEVIFKYKEKEYIVSGAECTYYNPNLFH